MNKRTIPANSIVPKRWNDNTPPWLRRPISPDAGTERGGSSRGAGLIRALFSLALLFFCGPAQLRAQTLYQNNFEKEKVGSVPNDFLVLDGAFAVKEENGNKFLELPGTPLDTFGVLFGPNAIENVAVSARIFGTSKGRRYPAFDVGLNGAGGYKLRVSPAKKQLAIYRGDTLKKSVPLEWHSGQWTFLKLEILKTGEKTWKIDGKEWQEGSEEPAAPAISITDSEAPPNGRASVTGLPFSGTPIRFDDLLLSKRER